MVGIKDSLTTKLGPLPIAVWVGVPTAGYIGYKWWANKNAAPVTTADGGTVDSGFLTTADLGSADSFTDGYSDAAGSYNVGSTAGNTYAPPAIVDNQEWGRQVMNWLIGQGFDPLQVLTAINGYLYGTEDSLNTQQAAILKQGLTRFGAPPEPVTTIPSTVPPPTEQPPPPANTPPPPPPAQQQVTFTATGSGLGKTATANDETSAWQAVANQIRGDVNVRPGSYVIVVDASDGRPQAVHIYVKEFMGP